MNTAFFIRLVLTFHFIGVIIMAGTTVSDYFTFKLFCRLAGETDNKALGLLPIMSGYGVLVRTGAVILIATGIGLLVLTKGVLWEQLWFKIKMALVVLLILNGMLVGNKQGLRFRQMVVINAADIMQQTVQVRAVLNRFYWMQLAFFIAILLVSVIKITPAPINR